MDFLHGRKAGVITRSVDVFEMLHKVRLRYHRIVRLLSQNMPRICHVNAALTARAEELSADVISESPNDLVAAALRGLVWRKEQHEFIGNFESVRFQAHAAVGEVLHETGTFSAGTT